MARWYDNCSEICNSVMASFESSLKCPICSELLNDPKQLSCTHTFCMKCLIGLLACPSKSETNVLACPICQNTTSVAGGDARNLNTNVSLKCLVEEFRNSKGFCSMCDKKAKAKYYCSECGLNMCKTCLKIHNKWSPNLKHEVVRVEDIREGRVILKKKILCQEHKSEGQEHVCTDVCRTCKKFICLRSRMLHHEKKGHTVQDAEEYNNSIGKEIEYLIDEGKAKAATVKDHVSFVESQMNRVLNHMDNTQAQINKEYEELSQKLRERKAALDWQLYVQKKELRQKLEVMKDDNEKMVATIESASELVSHSLKAPLAGHIVSLRESLSGELKNELDRDDPEKKSVTDVADRAEQLTFTPNNQRDEMDIGKLRFVKCALKCEVDLPKKDSTKVMAATPEGKMAVGYSTGGTDIFSEDGKLQRTVLQDVRISGLGLLSDGRYVALDTNNAITLCTPECEKQDVRFETLSYGEGGIGSLTVDSDDQIYVGYEKAKKIQVFSPAGGKGIREIPCDGYYEPMQVTSNGDDLIVKQYDNVVIGIDKKGNIKHELTKPSDHCVYAAVSRGNSVLIASVRHEEGLLSIDEYTTELKHMTTLISDFKIEKPERNRYYFQQFQSGEIAFCTPGRLYIFNLLLDNGTAWFVQVNSTK